MGGHTDGSCICLLLGQLDKMRRIDLFVHQGVKSSTAHAQLTPGAQYWIPYIDLAPVHGGSDWLTNSHTDSSESHFRRQSLPLDAFFRNEQSLDPRLFFRLGGHIPARSSVNPQADKLRLTPPPNPSSN